MDTIVGLMMTPHEETRKPTAASRNRRITSRLWATGSSSGAGRTSERITITMSPPNATPTTSFRRKTTGRTMRPLPARSVLRLSPAYHRPARRDGRHGRRRIARYARRQTSGGNHVVLSHANGEYSLLAHLAMDSIQVKVGDHVKTRQFIDVAAIQAIRASHIFTSK